MKTYKAALTVVNLGTTSSETVELNCNRGLQVLLLGEPHVMGLSIADFYPSQTFWIRDSKALLSFFPKCLSKQ